MMFRIYIPNHGNLNINECWEDRVGKGDGSLEDQYLVLNRERV